MKRILFAAAVAVLIAPVAELVLAKGHVPSHKSQVCHRGRTLTVGSPAVAGHLGHGDVQLPVDDINNIFHTGDDCSSF